MTAKGKPPPERLIAIARAAGPDAKAALETLTALLQNTGNEKHRNEAHAKVDQVIQIPGGPARLRRLLDTGRSHRDATALTLRAGDRGLTDRLDQALGAIEKGEVTVVGSTVHPHEIVQAVEVARGLGGGVIDVGAGSEMGVEGVHVAADGTQTPVSFKHLQPAPGKINFVREIKQNEIKIRKADALALSRPQRPGDPIPQLAVGRSILHLETPHTVSDVEAEMMRADMRAHLLPGPSPSNPGTIDPPVYTRITVVCTDGEVVVTPAGYQITRRPP